ncbi:nuclear transport factor 2 family protein [Streptomyces sp. NPDC020719]|uniref:nuclear transport factor 2 family protein n=1 Tax=Streptomyces sp. NPDC020719 TaxID=3154896 RepID=UPI00340FDFB1
MTTSSAESPSNDPPSRDVHHEGAGKEHPLGPQGRRRPLRRGRPRRDAQVVIDSFAEDARWLYPGSLPISLLRDSREAIVNDFLGSMSRRLDPTAQVVIELINTFADGEQVLAEWISKATAANGAVYDNNCAGVCTVRDAKITSVTQYADSHHVAATLFAQD